MIQVSEVAILETGEKLLSFVLAASLERESRKGREECRLFNVEETFLEAGVKRKQGFQFLSRQKSAELL